MAEGDDRINGITGGFKSVDLAREEEILALESFDVAEALEIGEIAYELATSKKLSCAIEVRIGTWTV